MFVNWDSVRVFVRPGATDLRKQINGLAALAQTDMGQDPLSGNLYLFSNQDRRLLKALYWDRNGFCLWQKRLERQRYLWPADRAEVLELDMRRLRWLLEGLELEKIRGHRELSYTTVL